MARAPLYVLTAAALLLGGCSWFHGEKAFKPVSEEDFGRLQPDQLGPVDQARNDLFAARDDVSRAKLHLQEAQDQVPLASADQKVAAAAKQRAQAMADAAAGGNDPMAKARAQEAAAEAELQGRSAQAHLAFAQRLVAERQAEVDAAQRQVDLRQAELERARLTALTQAGIPAATKYDPSRFDAHVAQARQRLFEAQSAASARQHSTQEAENAWRTLYAQYQDRVRGEAALGAGTGQGPTPPPSDNPAP